MIRHQHHFLSYSGERCLRRISGESLMGQWVPPYCHESSAGARHRRRCRPSPSTRGIASTLDVVGMGDNRIGTGQRTATGPMPVWISRSGKCPWRTIRRRPAESVRCAYASTKPATSASTACPSKRRAPRRKTSVGGSSSNDPGWRSWTTVSSLMAYPSFVENGDSNIARIRRPHLIPSPTFDGAVKSRFLMRVGWIIIVHVYFTRPTDWGIV